ncbi:MAG: ABC transporter permease [Ruminococcus sp.]|nr:ABC transporter permease [Ruminococcus sp.]
MFLHELKYELLVCLRVKEIIIWLILFPICLGAFFKMALYNVYEKDIGFSTIEVAVVENSPNSTLHTVLDNIEKQDDAFLKATYTDKEEAEKLLKDKEVSGIIFSDAELSLIVDGKGMRSTMLSDFVKTYNDRQRIIMEAIKNDPSSAQSVIDELSKEVSTCTKISLSDGNPNYYVQYFYNLIAMVALFGSLTGLHITINNQANLSALGARKNCSPVPKSISTLASIIGSIIIQGVCMVICVTYIKFILKVDFGSHLPLVYISAFISGILGISLGFFVGAIGRIKTELKTSILSSVSLLSCFFSGLMVGNMKVTVQKKLPWFNKINPAAVITDSFHCLDYYKDYDMFITKIITMLVMSAIFMLFGFLISRRKKYADL